MKTNLPTRLTLALLCVLTSRFDYAQSDNTRYKPNEIKVGDRVEVNQEISNQPWLKGTVTSVNMSDVNRKEVDNYSVFVDAQNGHRQQQWSAIADHAHIRKIGEASVSMDKMRVAPSGCGCSPVKTVAKKGAPSEELFKNLLRAQYDKPAEEGLDGMVCTTITSFQIGPSYTWQPNLNPQQVGTERLGSKAKTVYPIKANYIVCTTYRTAWQTTTWTNTTYLCFRDELFGEWKIYGINGFQWKFENKRVEHP